MVIRETKLCNSRINIKDVRKEKPGVQKSLGEVLKHYRENCKMTQQFVAEEIGISRQAVSKWERQF